MPVALGGIGNNRGAVIAGLALGLFQQAANFLVGGVFASVAVFGVFIVVLLLGAAGPVRRTGGAAGLMARGRGARWRRRAAGDAAARQFCGMLAPFVVLFGLACAAAADRQRLFRADRGPRRGLLGAGVRPEPGGRFRRPARDRLGRAADARRLRHPACSRPAPPSPPVSPYLALAAAAVVGAVAGVIIGLPALAAAHLLLRHDHLRLRHHRHADRDGLAERHRRRHRRASGRPSAVRSPPPGASTTSAWRVAALCTWLSANVAHSRFGRALLAIRDAEVAAEASGISKPVLLMLVFLFAGATAAIAGGLFASLQSYITPDAFTFDLSLLFFIAILIGGRGSILGPLLGTVLLTAAAGGRRAVGRLGHLPLRRAAAGDRAAGARRHRQAARFRATASRWKPAAPSRRDEAMLPAPAVGAQRRRAASTSRA